MYFAITCNDKKYDSVKPIFNHGDIESALNVLLKDLKFVDDSKMILTYDYQNKIEFVLEFLGYGSTNGDVQYPNICDGAGKGAIDGVSGDELKSIVDETDRLGYSTYHNTIIDVDGSEIEEEFDIHTLMSLELENYGFYLTNHPVTEYKLKYPKSIAIEEISSYFDQEVEFVCLVDRVREITTKKQDKMAFLSVSDEVAETELVLFPKVYSENHVE